MIVTLVLGAGWKSSKSDCRIQRKYLMAEVKGLCLGMSLDEFSRKKSNFGQLEIDNDMGFRKVYLEKAVDMEGVLSIVYYFDSDGSQPLYEIIIQYSSEYLAKGKANKKLGKPNDGDEWRFTSVKTGLSYDIKAWIYKSKVVIAAMMDGTEWENDGL